MDTTEPVRFRTRSDRGSVDDAYRLGDTSEREH